MYQVTYFNAMTQQRHVLIDAIDMATALGVREKFGDEGRPLYFMPDLRIECMPELKSTEEA